MQIITNNEKHNHMGKLVQMSAQANMMIIVSAFISGNLGKMFDSMPTIKQVTIYTNLSGYDDGADKIIALFDFCNYCKKKGIDLLIKSDDDLHGKVVFLSEKVKELNRITSEIEAVFPEKSFKLDGILIGNIVEVLTAQAYGITLYKQSEKTHDGEVDGKKVQIKGTQGKESIVIREEPEYLLVEYLDTLYAISYGMCQKYGIKYGRPKNTELRQYYLERKFLFNDIVRNHFNKSQEIECSNGHRYSFEKLEMIQSFGMLCPECAREHKYVQCNLTITNNNILELIEGYVRNSLGLNDKLEYEILNYLGNNSSESYKASTIAEELDCTYQLIAKRASKLIDRELVFVEKQDIRKYYKITSFGLAELDKRKMQGD